MKKDLNYWKKNAEEDYMKVPISVLRYITELEKVVLPQADVSGQLKAFAKHWNETRADFVTIDDCDIEDFLSL